MSKNLILIIGILLIWFLMIRKSGTENKKETDTKTNTSETSTQSTNGLIMSKSYTL